MKNYNDYRSPPSDTLLWSGKKLFQRKLEDFGENVKVDNVDTKAIIMTHSNPYNEMKEDRKFLCEDTIEIDRGSIVDYNDAKWLVISEVKSNNINKYTKIFQCNNIINLYVDNILHKIPCIVESNIRLYQLGVDENKYISEPSTNIVVRLPNNEITSYIKRDDIYKLGLQNYKVVDISDIIEPGLLILKMEYSQESQEEYNYNIEILNGDNIQIAQSQSLILNVEVENNGEVIDNPSLTYLSSDESIATVDENGIVNILEVGIVEFTVCLKDDLNVNASIIVEIIEDKQDNFTYTLDGDPDIYVGMTTTFTANKYNNGVLVEDVEFEFSIIPESTPTNAYALTVLNNNQCSVKANQKNYNIILRATDLLNNQIVEKEIKLLGLF